MRTWLRKSFVILITVLTFGMVSPSQFFAHHLDEGDQPKREIEEQAIQHAADREEIETSEPPLEERMLYTEKEQFLVQVIETAETYAYMKFGTKIKPVIANEFQEMILPEIEKVIEKIVTTYEEKDLQALQVTELPTSGKGELIFNLRDLKTNEDIVRFHVRRDHPPQAGYWFNFHYHVSEDDFQHHHDLGSIYWNKNTPPRWLN